MRTATRTMTYLEVILVTMAAATTGLGYAGFFTTRGYLWPLLGAAGCATVLATAAALRRWRVMATTLTAVLGFVVLAVAAVLTGTLDHGLPTARTVTDLGDGLLHGWIRMLSVGLPADVGADLLLTPTLLTWTAAFVSTTVVLRTRALLAPVVAPLLALTVALLFTASVARTTAVVTAALLTEVLLLVAVRVVRLDTATRQVDPGVVLVGPPVSSGRRVLGRLAFAVPVVAVVAAGGIAGSIYVPVADGSDRYDPRTVVPQRFDVDDTLTPLVTLKSQLREQPARTLFTVRVDRDSGVSLDRIRSAALDTYDGALWTSRDSFLVAGRTLAPDPTLESAREVAVHVSVRTLTGPYVPTVGWPSRVSGGRFGFSDASGVLVTRSGSLRGAGYDLVGLVRPADDGIRSAVPNPAVDDARYTQLAPGLPTEISERATALTAQAPEPYAKLLALESYLRRLPYSLEARPGHSYDALRRLFGSDPQDRVGYAEQYAAAFAVLARSLGFPTRVAVGYLLRPGNRQDQTFTVTTADAHAWPEVNLSGYGWVAFEPTDFTQGATAKPLQPTAQPGSEEKPAQGPNPGAQPVIDPNLHHGPGTATRIITGSLIALAVLVALLVLTPLLVAAEKYRRRHRRRRRGSHAARVLGAWRESTDRLVERGVQVPQSLTPWEVSLRAEAQLGRSAAAVGLLAPLATAATSAPVEPPDFTVTEAWELSTRLRRDLRRERGRLRSLAAVFDPRPLTHGWQDRHRRRRTLKRMRAG